MPENQLLSQVLAGSNRLPTSGLRVLLVPCKLQLLLNATLAPLHLSPLAIAALRLPGSYVDGKNLLDLFQWLAGSLGEAQERVNCHGSAKNAEN